MALVLLGNTANFSVSFENSLPTAQVQAQAVLDTCENDLSRLASEIGTPIAVAFGQSNRIQVQLKVLQIPKALGVNQGFAISGATLIQLLPRNAPDVTNDAIRAAFVAELAEVLNSERSQNAQKGFAPGTNGTSLTEGLSRIMAAQLYPAAYYTKFSDSPAAFGPVVTSWINTRPVTFITQTQQDESTFPATGCAALFLNYLRFQLHHPVQKIINAGGATLSELYQNLTESNTAVADFTSLLDKHLPLPAPSNGFGVTSDNIFPLFDPSARTGNINFSSVPSGQLLVSHGKVHLGLCQGVASKFYTFESVSQNRELILSVQPIGFADPVVQEFFLYGFKNDGTTDWITVGIGDTVACAVTVGREDPSQLGQFTYTTEKLNVHFDASSVIDNPAQGRTIVANFSPDLGAGTVYLMARVDLAERFVRPVTVTQLTASIKYVVDSIKFGKDYDADRAACDAVWRHLVQFQPIPIWKTLPDPTPGPWVDAIQWLAALREEVRLLAEERPATAQTITLLFSSQFGVSTSLLGDDDLYRDDKK